MSDFKDDFSGHAPLYKAYRPRYPAELFDWLAGQAPATRCAWDYASGNDQAAVALASHFDRDVATDASKQQIAIVGAIREAIAPKEKRREAAQSLVLYGSMLEP